MHVSVDNRCANATSFRAAYVKSLFNAEDGSRFTLEADLPIDDPDWSIGVVVGPSGSGKSSIGHALWGGEAFYEPSWSSDRPIIDEIAPDADTAAVTAALGSVGLGDVPAWLRPYSVLSNGERFRADLARIVSEAPARVVVDEFTSVVDRQIARVGAQAFAKSWRRNRGCQAVLLTCHYDILDWVAADWEFDTQSREFTRGCQRRRPPIEVEIREGGWGLWPLFKPHHYLDSGPMPAARCYVAFVDGEPVAHLGMGTKNVTTKQGATVEARACRMVVMPEWQGAGIGMRFLNHLCQRNLEGVGRIEGERMTTLFHTSHPVLCQALRRDPCWRQVSGVLHGERAVRNGAPRRYAGMVSASFGGHFRAVSGFRYVGPPKREATQ